MIEGVEQHGLEELLWLLMNFLHSPRKTSVPGHDSQLEFECTVEDFFIIIIIPAVLQERKENLP